jgi:soluble lytic murein transglycosylase-like protein
MSANQLTPVVDENNVPVVFISTYRPGRTDARIKGLKKTLATWKVVAVCAAVLFMGSLFYYEAKFKELAKVTQERNTEYVSVLKELRETKDAMMEQEQIITNISHDNITLRMTLRELSQEREFAYRENPEISAVEVPQVISLSNEKRFYDAVPLAPRLQNYIIGQCDQNDIPKEIVFALAWKESTFNPAASSTTRDHGLFQINEINFEHLSEKFEVDDIIGNIYDAEFNTDCAIQLLRECINEFGTSDWHTVLMAYNMGRTGARNALKQGIYSTKYSRAILTYAEKELGFHY